MKRLNQSWTIAQIPITYARGAFSVSIAMAHLTGSVVNVEFFKEPPCLLTLNEDLTIDRPIPWITRKTCHVFSIGLLLFDLPAIGTTQALQRSIQ